MEDRGLVHGLTIGEWKQKAEEYVGINNVHLKVCKYCGAVFVNGKWINDNINNIIEKVISRNFKKIIEIKYPLMLKGYSIRAIDINNGINNINVRIELNVAIEDKEINIDKDIAIKLLYTVCPRCLAKKIKAYDTIIQIRGYHGLSQLDLMRIHSVINKLPSSVRNEIVDIKKDRNGIDILLNDKGLGRYIAKVFERETGANIIESYKLISRKPDGKTKSRLTISVRLPPVNTKFFIESPNGNLLFVYGISDSGYIAYDLDKENRIIIPFKDYWRWKRRELYISWRIMRVIGSSKNRVILLDENDYTTYEGIPLLSEEFLRDERVSVLEYKGKIYVIKTETLERGLHYGKEKEEKKSRRKTQGVNTSG